jgi:hypothetical protein
MAERLGREAARIVKKARPTAERLAAETAPKLRETGRNAVEFAREHEDELRDAASRLARARLTGPLGLVVNAVTANPMERPAPPGAVSQVVCPSCSSPNPPVARFCNQCGAPMGRNPQT